MSKPKVANTPAIDPTLPKVFINLKGKQYHLVFTFAALALAESKLREQGTHVNMLHALDLSTMSASSVVPVLYAALLTHDPAMNPIDVASLVTFQNLPEIFRGLAEAYAASTAELDSEADKAGADPLDQAA